MRFIYFLVRRFLLCSDVCVKFTPLSNNMAFHLVGKGDDSRKKGLLSTIEVKIITSSEVILTDSFFFCGLVF